MTDELAARDAVIARLNTLLAPQVAYTVNQIRSMTTLPDAYVEVVVYRRFIGAPRRAGSAPGVTSFRARTRAVGNTEDNALLMAKKASGLERSILTVGAGTSTEVDYETSEPVAEDEDRYSGYTLWTFTV